MWVYFFALFALAAAQRFAFPPDEHPVAVNVTVFAIGAVIVIAVVTAIERASRR